jgi:hypothetical protein
MNEQLDTILRDYKNGQKLDGSGDLYTIVDARQSLLQLIEREYKKGFYAGQSNYAVPLEECNRNWESHINRIKELKESK